MNALLHPAGTRLCVTWVDQSTPRWLVRTDELVVERPHPSGTTFRWADGFLTVTIRPSQIVDVEVVS